MKTNKILVPVLLTALLGFGGGFFAGTKYQESHPSRPTNFQGIRGQFTGRTLQGSGNPNPNFRQNARPINGEITALDDKSLTVKLPDGSSKLVLFSDSTSIDQMTKAAKTDLTIGSTVFASGQENSDGSLTATRIELNPPQRNIASPAPTN